MQIIHSAVTWENYRRTRSPEIRARLLTDYLPLVRRVAGRMLSSLPRSVRLEDLQSAGTVGLLSALESFDPSLGIKFETYASSRIRGAMVDSLRELDWVPRSIRHKARQLDRATEELTQQLGRIPAAQEIASRLGLTVEAYQGLLDEVNVSVLLSLDEGHPGLDHDSTSLEGSPDATVTSNHDRVEEEELHGLLVQQLKSLPDQEKLVLALYYYEELTFRAIGDVLHLTESRVSQIHSKAIRSLGVNVRRSMDR